jgi:hypothetical protein
MTELPPPPAPSAKDAARAVLAYLRVYGWTKHVWRDRDGRSCLVGAYRFIYDRVAVTKPFSLGNVLVTPDPFFTAFWDLVDQSPISWNDAAERTWADVETLLLRIAECDQVG